MQLMLNRDELQLMQLEWINQIGKISISLIKNLYWKKGKYNMPTDINCDRESLSISFDL